MKKMSNASRRCHQRAAQLVKESKVRSHKTQPMFPEHERCHKPQRWDTGFGTGEEEQEITGWQRGESLFSLGRPGAGFVARAEDSQESESEGEPSAVSPGFAAAAGGQCCWGALQGAQGGRRTGKQRAGVKKTQGREKGKTRTQSPACTWLTDGTSEGKGHTSELVEEGCEDLEFGRRG